MVLTGLTISSERIEVVDFAYPFWEERLAMITLTEPRHQFYLFKPLTIPVWLLYVFAAVYVALCIKSLECISLYLHHGVSLARDALGQTLLFTWGAMWNIGKSLFRMFLLLFIEYYLMLWNILGDPKLQSCHIQTRRVLLNLLAL